MENKEFYHKIASLESRNDYLETELEYFDFLLREVGFENGLVTFKATAEAMIERNINLQLEGS